MTVKFDSTFERAETLLRRSLSGSNTISIGVFNSELRNVCNVKNFEICNIGREAEDEANLTMTIVYSISEIDKNGRCMTYDKSRTLNFLSANGDIYWTYNMIEKVWDGLYPSTICFDAQTYEVYIVYVKPYGLELRYFGVMDEALQASLETLNYLAPYKICIEPMAMFQVLDGGEGINHLKRNLYIEFDCGHPVKLSLQKDIERVI